MKINKKKINKSLKKYQKVEKNNDRKDSKSI